MFDLGRTVLAVVERSPDALAIVDGERRLCYAAWYDEISRVAGGLITLGLSRGDRLAVILQNRLEMATLHWACQLAGIVATPLNLRIKDICLPRRQLCIRGAKGGNDRVVALPGSLLPEVVQQLQMARGIWQQDKQDGLPLVLPHGWATNILNTASVGDGPGSFPPTIPVAIPGAVNWFAFGCMKQTCNARSSMLGASWASRYYLTS